MSLQKSLRAMPELQHFSRQQQEDLLLSFAPDQLRRKTFRSAAFRGMMISYMIGAGAQFVVPPGIALAIIAGVMMICIPVCYALICRQIRDEFRMLLLYLLTGKVLPACPRCGYDLQRAKNPQCPECGADVKWKPAGEKDAEVDGAI